MRPVKYQLQNKCRYKECGIIFYSAHRRKYCSYECSEHAQRDNRPSDKLDKDPTPEEIAEMCRQIREGEIFISQGAGSKACRQKPNWAFRKG